VIVTVSHVAAMARAWRARARLAPAAATLLTAVLVASSCAGSRASCAASSGGQPGVDAQLRFLDANDGQVIFTFGASPLSNTFGVPSYTIEQATGPDGLTALRIRFQGASMRYPDGTTSYNGPLRIAVRGHDVLSVALSADVDRTSTWMVTPQGSCPVVASKTYVYGKSPRAQLALTFGGSAAFTLESTSDYIGAPQDTPVQASGLGFAPASTIVIAAAGKQIWDTASNPDGTFDSGFNIGYLDPGIYEVTASDGHGHRGATRLTVIARPPSH